MILGKRRVTGEVSSCYCVVIVRVCYSSASVLSQVPCHGDCPLELMKVVLEFECVALHDGIVLLCEELLS